MSMVTGFSAVHRQASPAFLQLLPALVSRIEIARAILARARSTPMAQCFPRRGGETFEPVTAMRTGIGSSSSFIPSSSASARTTPSPPLHPCR